MVRVPIKRQRGALMLAVAVILAALTLTVLVMFVVRQQQRALDVSKAPGVVLARIDAALAAFVTQYRRLPCPARGSIASGALTAGRESIDLTTGQCLPANQLDGVVPWSTLGLTETDGLDPWSARISYRVQPSLASNLLVLMNMSWCDPAASAAGTPSSSLACKSPCSGNACTHPNTYLYAKGLQVKDASGAWLNQPAPPWPGAPAALPPKASGAAYVLLTHGPNGAGAYNAAGVLQAGAPGSAELGNRNGQALTAATVFTEQARNDTSGPAYFDDLLSHPTLTALLEAAALGARTPH